MKDEALRLALEALESCWEIGMPNAWQKKEDAITAIKAALEAKDEPVAWYDSVSGWIDYHSFKPTRKPSSPSADWLPLYATPPQRKPLTDEEIERIYNRYGGEMINCAKAIERAHGIKGEA